MWEVTCGDKRGEGVFVFKLGAVSQNPMRTMVDRWVEMSLFMYAKYLRGISLCIIPRCHFWRIIV
jgi:hypothetical protein